VSEPRLHLELDGDRFAAGDMVRGTVLIVEGGESRRLCVSLNYRELTNDEYEATTFSLSTDDLHTGELVAGAAYPFELTLPPDALPNYKSAHGELFWEVDAHSDERGRDTHERRRIEVSARPRE
jgi:hypothetical protein